MYTVGERRGWNRANTHIQAYGPAVDGPFCSCTYGCRIIFNCYSGINLVSWRPTSNYIQIRSPHSRIFIFVRCCDSKPTIRMISGALLSQFQVNSRPTQCHICSTRWKTLSERYNDVPRSRFMLSIQNFHMIYFLCTSSSHSLCHSHWVGPSPATSADSSPCFCQSIWPEWMSVCCNIRVKTIFPPSSEEKTSELLDLSRKQVNTSSSSDIASPYCANTIWITYSSAMCSKGRSVPNSVPLLT
jgi:hypothetical protein